MTQRIEGEYYQSTNCNNSYDAENGHKHLCPSNQTLFHLTIIFLLDIAIRMSRSFSYFPFLTFGAGKVSPSS
jgi:hypothetical protein